ncbi:CdaR family protein [Actinomadura algeriensis]|uniref:Basic secretory peptidase family protein n=1 Tax=Actinomadura algeriensis TaxID=1679523 RepID=A0ABR9JYG4_9ACTN|nr:hypothetical protein [Actinomadura algeriensis]MBE1535140.1 hypothetical protein [Actinomadura algeriensis]
MTDDPDAGERGPVSRRRALALGAGGAALLAAGGAGLLGARTGEARPSPGRTAGAGRAGPFEPARAEAVLARRAAAVGSGDRAAFLATVAAAPAEFRAAEARRFDNLRRLPLGGWREEITVPRLAEDADAVVVRVETRYRFRGFDDGDAARVRQLTFAPRSGGWAVSGDGSAHGFFDDAAIWDAGPLTVVRGRASLVIGDTTGLDGLAALLDAAVPAVTDVVGTGWARRAVALAPADPGLAGDLAGSRTEDVASFAALAAVTPGPGKKAGRDRVVVSPATFGRLNDLGRRVVLTHELTHVATGGARDDTTPLWLIEGFADYVGYRDAGIGVRDAAAELRREVTAGRPPARLPAAGDFAGGARRLSQSYQEAWLACRMIAERYGEATLVRLYRAAGRTPVDAALREELGLTPDRFTAMWLDYLTKELT